MGYSYPKVQVEEISWGFKIISGEPYLDDDTERYTDAKAMFWDTEKKVIVENA